jgi:hypothetical protein
VLVPTVFTLIDFPNVAAVTIMLMLRDRVESHIPTLSATKID